MTAADVIARLRRPRSARVRRRPQTLGELLAGVGRLVLWLALGVVLARGLTGILAATPAEPTRPLKPGPTAAAWPDDSARAFATDFATAYLTHAPEDTPDATATALVAFATPELISQLAPRYEQDASRQAVRSVTVARSARLDDRHALITVSVTLATPELVRRLVTVPVARDQAGGLVVDDLPAFASAPGRAAVAPTEGEALLGPERDAISDVVTRFLRAYLAGDTSALAYLVPPGTRMTAAAGRWELLDVTSIAADGPARRGQRLVLVSAQARDVASRATYALRYRVRLVRRERWYVADLNGPREG